MSQVVGLKLNSGAATVNFTAVIVTPSFFTDESRFTLLDFTRKRTIHGKWRQWNIVFTLLEEVDQDFLLDYAAEEAPQAVIATVTHDVEVLSVNPNFRSGTLNIVARTPEP